jgi:hypothetical protein
MVGVGAWSFLKFYKLALEVTEKKISLFKMVKEFLSSPLASSTDLENQVKTTIDDYLRKAVETTISAAQEKVSPERSTEIKVKIDKDARIVVQAIANGARVGVTIESLNSLSLISDVMPEPHPISRGSISVGNAERRTNRMPVRAARDDTRVRPPLSFGGSGGNNGSIINHSASGSNGEAIISHESRCPSRARSCERDS